MKKLLVILLLLPYISFSQLTEEESAIVDSLQDVIQNAEHDSIIIKAWNDWDQLIYYFDVELDLELNLKMDSLSALNLETKLVENEETFYLKVRAAASNNLGSIYYYLSDFDKAIEYYLASIAFEEKLGNELGVSRTYNNIGAVYSDMGDYDKSLEYYEKSVDIKLKHGDQEGLSQSYNNIGILYSNKGDYSKCIEYYTRSLKIDEQLEDKHGMTASYNNIGLVYVDQGENDIALEYFKKSLSLAKENKDKRQIATAYNSIGKVYNATGENKTAIEYYEKCIEIAEEVEDGEIIAITLNNIGSAYEEMGENEKAIEYFQNALEMHEEIGFQQGISNSLNGLGRAYLKLGKYSQGLAYGKKSLQIAQEIGATIEVNEAAKTLWKINKSLGKYSESLRMYELYIETRDSIESIEHQQEIIRQEYKYAYEKQTAADSVAYAKEKEIATIQMEKQEAEIKVKRNQQYVLIGGLLMIALFAGFVYQRFKVTSKQKVIIEHAHQELEEKNQEIIDSITYAKRIQSAILPPQKLVKEYLQDSFILYSPKDIVAGDFYWLETKDDHIIFAAADCTGHGVPGAMVSVVCNNGLNRSVREHGLTDPGEILDKTREIVIQEFEKSEEEVKDGMDIALVSLTLNKKNDIENENDSRNEVNTHTHSLYHSISPSHSQPHTHSATPSHSHSASHSILKYAGAHNPLWIIRNGAQDVEEIKADKQPIGKFGNAEPFTTHTTTLNSGDTIYIFSDGFADQFGGDKGKKFKAKNFKTLLLSIQSESMDKQRVLIHEAFEEWKGSLEQLDDVCVIGVRI
ncbi:tetratricopeptide repeat protein [Paracrocinitomix mangrovi]|uniref:tetratricopeptide repeat protein n=1 Tax=Paracrocinitomix mangrovi TaxID=2862509 RepID=UPI001C8E79C3|nr:tetratricopeptide repeat protein [Paracrocinitomix mangrovi]UKN02277.1 tetratricopeptide repeat protein [Paracrocinitomix mangrovi]